MLENEFPSFIHTIKYKFTFDPKSTKEKINNIGSYIEDMQEEINLHKKYYERRFVKYMDKPKYNFWGRKMNDEEHYNLTKLYWFANSFKTTKIIYRNWCNNIIQLCEELNNELYLQ
jgi:hypothetical protein